MTKYKIERQFKCPCPVNMRHDTCGKVFNFNKDYRKHVESEHREEFDALVKILDNAVVDMYGTGFPDAAENSDFSDEEEELNAFKMQEAAPVS